MKTVNRDTVQQVSAVLRPDQLALFQGNIERVRKDFGTIAANPNPDNPPGSDAPPPAAPTVGSETNAPAVSK